MKRPLIISGLLSFILLIAINPLVFAQNFTVTGTVINAETGQEVEFANIGVEGTYLGTASDLNGNFELVLSESIIDKQISVSAVGYKPKTYLVKEWEGKEGFIVQLAPMYYGISQVNVAAKSKIGYGIIRAASNLIVDNYINNPYSYSCYLRTVVDNHGAKTKSEAIVELTDSKGYGARSFTESFQSINYRIKENNPGNEVLLLREGLTFIDHLISQDIVRNPGNILSVESINEFDVDVFGEEMVGSDSIWIISYTCKKPGIHNTGDPELKDYKGKIWISSNNNEVLKNSFEATRKGKFRHGNSFNNDEKQDEELKYKVETTYKLNGDKYALNSVNYIQEEANGKVSSVYLKVVEVANFNDEISQRQYFNGDLKNAKFWNNYKRP